MSKKESYIKYKKLAEKLLNKYGTEKVNITLAMNIGDDDVPFQVNPQKVVEYNTVGVMRIKCPAWFSLSMTMRARLLI